MRLKLLIFKWLCTNVFELVTRMGLILMCPNSFATISFIWCLQGDDESLNVVLEFVENGSLHDIGKKFGIFPESLVRIYIMQILEGLLYLHKQNILHRDIKARSYQSITIVFN